MKPHLAPPEIDRSAPNTGALTSDADGFAVTRALRGSRPMGAVADLSNVYRRTLQRCSAAVNRVRSIVSSREAKTLFPFCLRQSVERGDYKGEENTANLRRSVGSRCLAGPQDNLLFIPAPHRLVKVAKRRIVLLLQRNQVQPKKPLQM
jgi:hypothetical protein